MFRIIQTNVQCVFEKNVIHIMEKLFKTYIRTNVNRAFEKYSTCIIVFPDIYVKCTTCI